MSDRSKYEITSSEWPPNQVPPNPLLDDPATNADLLRQTHDTYKHPPAEVVAELDAARLVDDAVDAWHDAGAVPLDERVEAAVKVIQKHYAQQLTRQRAQIVTDLRRAAEGRRHYAAGYPEGHELREHLEHEARMLDSAAKIAEGSRQAMCGLLPVHMWSDAENAYALGKEAPDAQ